MHCTLFPHHRYLTFLPRAHTIARTLYRNSHDLDTLSRKGHFLKGSSAALGLQRVQHSCESMQHFGNRQNEFGEGEKLSEGKALKKCRKLLERLRLEQDEAREWLMVRCLQSSCHFDGTDMNWRGVVIR